MLKSVTGNYGCNSKFWCKLKLAMTIFDVLCYELFNSHNKNMFNDLEFMFFRFYNAIPLQKCFSKTCTCLDLQYIYTLSNVIYYEFLWLFSGSDLSVFGQCVWRRGSDGGQWDENCCSREGCRTRGGAWPREFNSDVLLPISSIACSELLHREALMVKWSWLSKP